MVVTGKEIYIQAAGADWAIGTHWPAASRAKSKETAKR